MAYSIHGLSKAFLQISSFTTLQTILMQEKITILRVRILRPPCPNQHCNHQHQNLIISKGSSQEGDTEESKSVTPTKQDQLKVWVIMVILERSKGVLKTSILRIHRARWRALTLFHLKTLTKLTWFKLHRETIQVIAVAISKLTTHHKHHNLIGRSRIRTSQHPVRQLQAMVPAKSPAKTQSPTFHLLNQSNRKE